VRAGFSSFLSSIRQPSSILRVFGKSYGCNAEQGQSKGKHFISNVELKTGTASTSNLNPQVQSKASSQGSEQAPAAPIQRRAHHRYQGDDTVISEIGIGGRRHFRSLGLNQVLRRVYVCDDSNLEHPLPLVDLGAARDLKIKIWLASFENSITTPVCPILVKDLVAPNT
jgi:hypothetical protein